MTRTQGLLLAVLLSAGCSTSEEADPLGSSPSGAAAGAAGVDASGGSSATLGGSPSAGSSATTGGSGASGGSPAGGGSATTGGSSADGGSQSGGGSVTTGGSGADGGSQSGGGSAPTGGSTAGGGAAETGGAGGSSTGGASGGSGGSSPTGGTGGTAGSSSGGTGNVGGSGGTGGSTVTGDCKRGIAANIAPGAAFFPAITWWYNWAIQSSGADVGIEFVPMIWGSATAGNSIPAGSRFLLGFNEPNFFAQANLSAQQAASLWPQVEASAQSQGVPIVSPGMNFCGPANECHDTDPYQYLKDFFGACSGCKVDYIAVHWYNCDLPSLIDYLEPGGSLEGFEQFGLPIWITEFSCDASASAQAQEAYMREAIPYLEGKSDVFRYSWFSADAIPAARLINSDGSPTALGQVYIDLEQDCG
jgi:hypothetical protein